MQNPVLISIPDALKRLFRLAGTLVAVVCLLCGNADAQGVAQVSLSGVPPVLENLSVAAQVERYEQRQMSMDFIYTSPGISETAFRFRFLLEHNGMPVMDVTSEPVMYRPGVYRYETFDDFPEINFSVTLANMINQLNSFQGGLIHQTGNLAEGTYTLSIEPEAMNDALFISEIPAFATFTVRYVDPPNLISPADQSIVSSNFPLFSWTGVGGLPAGSVTEYELTIVELFAGQSPGIAIQGNPPVFNDVLTGPVFVYGADQLPLEPGKAYAWQVETRESIFNIPFTQQGLTEIYTFHVMDDEGYIAGSFDWAYPFQNPFAEVRVEEARIGPDNVMFDGTYYGTIGGVSGGFTFEDFIVSPDGRIIEGGRAILDRGVGFEAVIFGENTLQDFVPDVEYPQSAEQAIWFMPGFLQAGSDGIAPVGTGTAVLSYEGQQFDDLGIHFSQDFLISHQMRITRGEAVLSDNGLDIAVMDVNGFRFITDGEEDLLALMPDHIPLPDEEIAWLKLRDNGRPLVHVGRHSSGGVSVQPINGETPQVVLAAISGSTEIPVSLENIILDPAMQRVVSGTVSHTVDDTVVSRLLLDYGIPVELQQLTYTPSQSLQFSGSLVLFDQVFGPEGETTLTLDSSGRLFSAVNIHAAELSIPLVGNDERVALHLNSISGAFDFNLFSPDIPWYSLDIGADFVITGSGGTVTSAELFASYDANGDFYFNMVQGFETPQSAVLELDHVHFSLNRISHLQLSHTASAGFDFNATLDAAIRIRAGEHHFGIPLKNIELRNSGFLIPEQNLHDGIPGFEFPAFEMGPLELQLLAMRLPGLTFNWFDWSAGTPSGINPSFDFEIRFPGFKDDAGELAYAPVTLQDAGLDEGYITGALQTYTFQGGGAYVPFTGTSGIRVQQIAGGLYRDGNSQGMDIRMDAILHAPQVFSEGSGECAPPEFTLSLTETSRFTGRVENINLCKTFDLNVAMLHLGEGFVDFTVSGNQQSVVVGGAVTAELTSGWFEGAGGTGSLELNVITGELIDLSAELNNLTWNYPAGQPMFSFGLDQALFTPDGLTLDGSGSLAVSDQTVNVGFSGLSLDFQTGAIREGEVEIQGEFRFEVGVSPFEWSVTGKTELTPEDTNKALLALEPGLRINRYGLSIDGSATAHVRVTDVVDEQLTAGFDNFTLGFTPFGIHEGQIDLNRNENRIGYIDRHGFTFDNILAAIDLPEKLPLPGTEIAYLVLREGDQNLVELGTLSADGSTRSMRTPEGQFVDLVIAGIGEEGNHPEFRIAFDVTVNATSFHIVSGEIHLQLENNPYSLTNYGFPLDITQIRYAMEGTGFELTAGVRLKLPESLPNVHVDIETMLTFSDNGFESIEINDGIYSTTRVPDTDALSPLVSVDLPQDLLGLDVYGLQLKLNGQKAFRISGDLRSKFIRDTEGSSAPIHYSAAFDEAENSWLFTADISHLPGNKIPIYKAQFEQYPDSPLIIEVTDNEFGMSFAGKISIPELSDNFALSIDRLFIGSELIEIEAHAETDQQLEMFGDFLTLTIRDPGIEYSSDTDIFFFTLNGDLITKIQKAQEGQGQEATGISFDGLRAGTDGSFELASAELNLLGDQVLPILPDVFWMNELKIGYENSGGENLFLLSAGGSVKIPVPGKTAGDSGSEPDAYQSDFSFAIDSQGNVVENPELEFIFDQKEWPTLSGDPLTEFSLGSFATLQVTGVRIAFDVMQPAATKLSGAFAVHVNQGGGSSSTDQDGKQRVIRFGKAGDLVDSYGISYSFTDGLDFHVDMAGTRENPIFSFETAFFEVGLVYVKMEDSRVFDVEIGGFAGLNIQAVSGSMDYEGFRFGSEGIIDYGRPAGSFSVSVVDVVSLSVGGFAFEQGSDESPVQMPVLEQEENGGGDPVITTSYLDVRRYLSLTDVGITLGTGAFAGGVESVLYYEDLGDTTFFSIQNAVLELGDAGKLWANFALESGPGGFALEVAGMASIRNIALGAYGTVRKRGDDLSFGIFVAATGLNIDIFPVVPSTFILKGGGAGFFYRPEMRDFERVEELLEEMTGNFSYNNPNGLPDSDDLLFAVMIYGELGIIGSVASGFAIDGNVMLILTDAFANIDLNGILVRQSGTPGTLSAGMYLTVGWSNHFMLQGGIRVDIEYPVIDGNATVDFFLQGQQDTDSLVWGVTGNVRLKLINFVDINGNFAVNQSGMLVNLAGRIAFDVSVISVSSYAELSFWYYTSTGNLGVYTRFGMEAEILGGLAKAGVYVEGALIRESGNLLVFVQGGGYVSIAFVFTGDVNAWASIRKDESGTRFRGGLGRKKEYEDLIASSKDRAESLNREARELQSAILDAKIADVSLIEAQLQQAGINLRSLTRAEREQFADRMVELESRTYPITIPPLGTRQIRPHAWNHHAQAFQELADVIVRAPNQPERPGNIPSEEAMNEAVESLNSTFDDISEKLADIDREYDPELPAGITEESIQTPLTAAGPYEFVIDEEIEQNMVNSYQNNFDGLDELGEQYRQLLSDNEQVVGTYIDGLQEVNALTREALGPFEAISEYYARHMSYHKASYDFAGYLDNRYHEIAGWSSQTNNFQLFRDIYTIIGDQMYPVALQLADRHHTQAVIEHAANQYALVMELALENDSLRQTGALQQSISDFQGMMNEIRDMGDNGRAGNYTHLMRMTGEMHSNLWGSVLRYSYIPYRIWNRDEFNRLMAEHDAFLEDQLLPGYHSMVRTMGRMYAILSQMVEEHIALYDSYIHWADYHLTEEEKNTLLEERRKWSDLLQPPSIQSVNTESYLFERTNRLLVAWEASHPSGQLGQNVVRMNSASGFRPSLLLSTGTGTEFTRYLFPDYIDRNDVGHRFEFAVRGPAGTVVTFDTDWQPFNLGEGQSYESGVQGPPTDAEPMVEPPQQPEVDAPVWTYEGEPFIVNNDFIPFTALQPVQIQTPLQYEYAIRDTDAPEEEWLVEWTPVETTTELPNGLPISGYWGDLLGVDEAWILYSRLSSGQEIEQSFSGYFESSPLEHGYSYELYVRAVNAFGMAGEPGSLRFTFDSTPPVFQSNEIQTEVSVAGIEEAEQRQVIGFSEERPGRLDGSPSPPVHETTIQIEWPEANDAESGIYAYEVVVGPEEDPVDAFENDENSRVSISGDQPPLAEVPATLYSDPWYVHVRAENHARSRSYIRSEAHPPMTDVIRPYPGITRPGTFNNNLVLWEIFPAVDSEVQILGYQYAIAYRPFGADMEEMVIMRPFPEGTATDFEAGQYGILPDGSLAPGFIIAEPDWAQIETYHPRFIVVRSVNEQGLTSDEIVMNLDGMHVEDVTPPVPGEITHEYVTNFINYNSYYGEWLAIRVEGLHDPGSGISNVEFRLIDPATDDIAAEASFTPLGSNRTPANNITANLRHPGAGIQLAGRHYLLEVTVTNGAGLQTEQSAEVDLVFPPIPTFGLTASVEYRLQTEHLLSVTATGIKPNASGFSNAELMVEDYDTGEILLPWSAHGDSYVMVPHFHDIPDLYFARFNNDFWARKLRITMRVTDGIGQTTTVSISYGRNP